MREGLCLWLASGRVGILLDMADGPTRLQRLLCRDCFAPPVGSSDVTDGAAERDDRPVGPPDEDGIAALLAIALDTLDDERDRGRMLDTKTASMMSFTGLVLSINVALAKPLFAQDLGCVGGVAMKVAFLVAIPSLLAAVLVALVGVLMPQGYRGFGREPLRAFTTAAYQAMPRLEVHQRMIGAIDIMIGQNRPVNDCKAKLTKVVAGLLALGFTAVAAEAVTLGLRQTGI